jgi:predicted nuclease with RNAse H fold
VRRGFGLDLAGYSTGKSELAVATNHETFLSVVVLKGSPFSSKITSGHIREEVERREGSCLNRILSAGSLAVDVPIDLQGLPHCPTSPYIWGRTKRPIDRTLNGLPPLADKIGAIVARFQGAVAAAGAMDLLGVSLYETYPAASFAKLEIHTRGYKNVAQHDIRQVVCQRIGLADARLSDDEIDAVLCAVTAVSDDSHILEGDRLQASLFGASNDLHVPLGYRLLARLPNIPIEFATDSYDSWMNRNGI